ncbi:hypothetical protein ABEB36_000605 [Hypothenemus hampei]|uniref:C-type lectin domain-containing protein n=1 Tax=Hypothenemus hampei TaxID=57062 RepID=A0ABD1FBV9_HYPHA
MHVHGNPIFSISYRLVDYCYNITLKTRDGVVELKPKGQLQCTFRIHMPHGNRIALKLQIGDSSTQESTESLLNLQDVKNHNSSCQGLRTELYDENFSWTHCARQGDEERTVEIVSKGNKIVLKVSREYETSISTLRLRISYRADPISEIVGSCEFGWVAMRQFCVTVLDSVKLPWARAETECVLRGGHLVSVRSERDQKIVNDLLINR